MKIAIDGCKTGSYRGDCECGMSWTGHTERDRSTVWSPALPIAEAVVHMRMCHDDTFLQLVFTWRFENWLETYWRTSDRVRGLGAATMTR